MFIINLNYIVPLEQLDAHMTDHVKFLQTYYQANIFIASGQKVPRTGGIILAVAKTKEEVEAIMTEDPVIHSQLNSSARIRLLRLMPDCRRYERSPTSI